MTRNSLKVLWACAVLLAVWVFALFPARTIADDSLSKPPAACESGATLHHPESAYAIDNVTVTADRTGEFAVYKSFGINLPASATVNGIEVVLLAHADASTLRRTFSVSLSSDNGTSYTTALDAGDFGTGFVYRSVGGAANNWGRAWSADDFSDDQFRVKLKSTSGQDSIYMEYFQVKVYYTPDSVRPTVTVNQASGQLDPTGASLQPVLFYRGPHMLHLLPSRVVVLLII